MATLPSENPTTQKEKIWNKEKEIIRDEGFKMFHFAMIKKRTTPDRPRAMQVTNKVNALNRMVDNWRQMSGEMNE